MRSRTKKEEVPGDQRLGALIRQLRDVREKSLRDVARVMHNNRGRLGEIERGERMPEAGELIRLRAALELDDNEWMELNKCYLEALQSCLLGPLSTSLIVNDRTATTISPNYSHDIDNIFADRLKQGSRTRRL